LWFLADPPWHIDVVGWRSHHQCLNRVPLNTLDVYHQMGFDPLVRMSLLLNKLA
jgi:hypothetical protein